MPRKTDSGLSLVEVLIAATLGLLLLGALLRLLFLAFAASTRHADSVHNHQIATVLLSRLDSDFADTSKQGVAVSTPDEPGRLLVHLVDRLSDPLKWGRRLVLYQEGEEELERSVLELASAPTEPATPETPQDWNDLFLGDKVGSLRLQGVSRFRVTVEPGPLVRARFQVGQGERLREFEKIHFLRQSSPR